MTETMFPFVDSAVDLDAEEASGRNRKLVLAAGGVVGALVLGLGGYFLLGSGGSTPTAFVPVARPHVVAPQGPVSKPVVKPARQLPTAYKAALGRDPFKAQYVVPAVSEVPAQGAAPATVVAAPPQTTTSTSSTSSGSSVPDATAPYPLKLVSISKTSADSRATTWLVDGEKKTVLPAQRFGHSGEIVVLAFSKNAAGAVTKAIIQVGDDSPLDVAIGERVSVL